MIAGSLSPIGPVGLVLAPACLAAAATCARLAAASAGRSELRRRLGDTVAPGPPVAVPARVIALLRWQDVPGSVLGIAAVLGGVTGALVAGPFWSVVAPSLAAVAGLARWAHRLGDGARYDEALIDVVDELARQLRSGAGLLGVLPELASTVQGPVRADLEAVVARCTAGVPLADALGAWVQQRPRPGVRLVAATLGLGASSGGLRARAVDELAASLRRREQIRRDATALAGQAQLSAVVMTVSPLLFAALLAAGDPSARQFLLHAPAGLICVAVGLTLDLVAAAWMVRITAGAS